MCADIFIAESVNVDKCVVMSTSRNKVISSYAVEYKLLKRVTVKKYLGIFLEDKLSFSEHVDNFIRKVYRMLDFIFRVQTSGFVQIEAPSEQLITK